MSAGGAVRRQRGASKSARSPRRVAERRIRYPILWVAFIVLVLIAAGLSSSPDPTRQTIGLAMLLTPLAAFSILLALYYWRSRRDAVQ